MTDCPTTKPLQHETAQPPAVEFTSRKVLQTQGVFHSRERATKRCKLSNNAVPVWDPRGVMPSRHDLPNYLPSPARRTPTQEFDYQELVGEYTFPRGNGGRVLHVRYPQLKYNSWGHSLYHHLSTASVSTLRVDLQLHPWLNFFACGASSGSKVPRGR